MFEGLSDRITPLEYLIFIHGVVFIIILNVAPPFVILGALREFVWSRIRKVDYVEKYGEWAVVTGATRGIGKEYARQLSKAGLKVVLISRSEAKLKAVAAEISGETRNLVKYVVADFSGGQTVLPDIEKHLEKYEVGILVNNVGITPSTEVEDFMDTDQESIWNTLNVNVDTMVGMTRMLLPKMAARGKGAIINLASAAAFHPTPRIALYSATKSFVDTFSKALAFECAEYGVTVQTVSPFFVRTSVMSDIGHRVKWLVNIFWPKPDIYVRSALATLPYARVTTGYLPHWIQSGIFTLPGPWVWGKIAMRSIRKIPESAA